MPRVTEKLGLLQPELHELYDVEVQNENMQKIERVLVDILPKPGELTIEQALELAKYYVDDKLWKLVGTAPETLDTIQELAWKIGENNELLEVLNQAIVQSASKEEVQQHTKDMSIHVTQDDRNVWIACDNMKHSHSNNSVLDTITEALVIAWNDAVSHITDGSRHVTTVEKERLYSLKNYEHPEYLSAEQGLYKIVVDEQGHVASVTSVTKQDIVDLGIPSSNTWRGVVNNLTSTSTNDSLAAKQGRVLNEKIAEITTAIQTDVTDAQINSIWA